MLEGESKSAYKKRIKAEAAARAKAAKDEAEPAKKKKVAEEEEVDPTKYTENRYKQIRDIKAAGKNPYPHKFPTDFSIPEYIAKFGGNIGDGEQLSEQVSVAGRVMNYRASS